MGQKDVPFATFHVEHIIAKKHGGRDERINLALACNRCNLHKGSNVAGVDARTGDIVALFNPRAQTWSDHFRMARGVVVGRTPIGRATVTVCDMNAPDRVRLRRTWSGRRLRP